MADKKINSYFRILSYTKQYWRHIVLTFVFTILFAVLNGLSVYLTIPLLDALFQESKSKPATEQSKAIDKQSSLLPDWITEIKENATQTFNNFILSGDKSDVLIKICFLILLSFILKNIFSYLQSYFMNFVEYAAMKDLRDDAYKHLHKLPISYFKSERIGNLISRFTNDVNTVQASISATYSNLIKEPLTIIVFLVIAISISWQLTLFALVIVPLASLVIAWIGFILKKQTRVLQTKLADITSVLQETLSGVKIVKAFGMEEFENQRFMNETKNYFKLVLKTVRTRNFSSPVTEVLSVIIGAIIIYYGGLLVLQEKTLNASEFLGFLFAIFQMMPPIKELGGVNNRIQEATAAADRIFEIMDTEPDIKNKIDAAILKEFTDEIIFSNICFKYDDADENVLSNLNFSVKRGEIIALVGPSGGGKSTLVDLLPRFYDPTSGKITIDGIDIRDLTIESLRAKMGIVTQETFLFNTSIAENIAYGLQDYPMEKIIEAAKTANAHNFIMEMPNGYDTVVGERGVKLSGGQRQRLTIARSLLKNPDIMIFDEATSALDNESEILVQQAIERLMMNRTTFVIAHRLSTIRNATNILVLSKGKIIQQGTHNKLITEETGLYKKLYEMQFRDSDA
jgi:subfamily B ATP-binding cassette protein MsbA